MKNKTSSLNDFLEIVYTTKVVGTSDIRFCSFARAAHFSEEIMGRNVLCFLMKGECVASCNFFLGKEMGEGAIFFFPKSAKVELSLREGAELIFMIFDTPFENRDKLAFQLLAKQKTKEMSYSFACLSIKEPLALYLGLVKLCLQEKRVDNAYFCRLVERDLFFYLRTFYSDQDLLLLFFPILSLEIGFRDFILQNYNKVKRISELVELSLLSRTDFYVRFKENFGMGAKQWMILQMNERIKAKAIEPDVTVADLMDIAGVESESYFNRYMKRHFGLTPKRFILEMKKRFVDINLKNVDKK